MTVRETVSATKVRYGAESIPDLFRDAKKLIVSKGKSTTEVALGKGGAGQAELAALVLGPTGNLRAPTIRIGGIWLVGFHEDAWRAALGAA